METAGRQDLYHAARADIFRKSPAAETRNRRGTAAKLGGCARLVGFDVKQRAETVRRKTAGSPAWIRTVVHGPETTPLGIVFWAPAPAGARIVNAV